MFGLTRMRPVWWRVSASLWFVPSLAVVAAMLLGVGLVELDAWVQFPLGDRWPRLFGAGHEGARGMLTAIASSMITVAGVVFSVTIVALSLAASQYSPRVLRTFSSDRPTQFVLGAFVAIFAYCLVVLRTIRGGDEEARFVPSFAVLGGLVLAIVGIALLVYFIHHLADSLQASSIIARVTSTTLAVIESTFPESLNHAEPEQGESGTQNWRASVVVAARTTGYLVDIDIDRLIRFARARGRSLCAAAELGDFLVAGQPLLAVHGDEKLSETDHAFLLACHTLERQRTIEQDPAFGIQLIVDIASKALSPGINDASTAVLCIDRITQILMDLAPRRIERPLRQEEGTPRVITRGATFAALVDLGYHALRNDAREKPIVVQRLLWSLSCVGVRTRDVCRRSTLAEQALCIAEHARTRQETTREFADILDRANQLETTLRQVWMPEQEQTQRRF